MNETVGPGQYRCAACDGVFDKGWSDEEANAEWHEAFPGFNITDSSVVCDTCYEAMGLKGKMSEPDADKAPDPTLVAVPKPVMDSLEADLSSGALQVADFEAVAIERAARWYRENGYNAHSGLVDPPGGIE